VYVGAGAGAGIRVKTRVSSGASSNMCWSYRRRCRVAPTLSGFCYPGDKAKAVTRYRGYEGVRTLRPVHTVPCAGGRRLTTRGVRVSACLRTG